MKLDQCLFGYDDGHRLLASSLPLGVETSLLTELSDLAPGTVFSGSEGYWTGLPVPSLGRYVLMRTWPAPEMSRPGCVWTHALLIKPSVLESIEDLSVLQNFVIRPGSPFDRDNYSKPVDVDLSRNCGTISPANDNTIRKLIVSLYEMISTTVEIALPGELDSSLFAVWSQQWPRLRRNFRFQTAASRNPRLIGSTRFDITAVLTNPEVDTSKQNITDPSWLSAAILDVHEGANGSLRPFLWHYGRDVRRQRGSFRPLVEINMLDNALKANTGAHVFEIISNGFPAQNDAIYLKQDLVDGLLVSHAQAELIRLVVLHERDGITGFPFPTATGISKLASLWPQQSDEILSLAELTADTDTSMGKVVFENIMNIIQTPEFWPLTCSYPLVRKHMVKIRPDLLTNITFELNDEAIIDLLPLVPAKTTGLENIISRLIKRDSAKLSNLVFDNFTDIAIGLVVSAANDKEIGLTSPWLQELIRRPNLLLQTEVLSMFSCSGLLYDIADALGWLTPEVIFAGVKPWNVALMKASSDLRNDKLDTLNCFLIALAFTSGGNDGLQVVEQFYDKIHRKIINSEISLKARELLLSHLPDIGWELNWDIGLRFRLAVAKAYIHYQWPVHSYATLAKDKNGRTMLANAASKIPSGQPYFKAVSK
ncbi:hypothetical protein ACEUAK_17425 [Aeromonas veronii]